MNETEVLGRSGFHRVFPGPGLVKASTPVRLAGIARLCRPPPDGFGKVVGLYDRHTETFYWPDAGGRLLPDGEPVEEVFVLNMEPGRPELWGGVPMEYEEETSMWRVQGLIPENAEMMTENVIGLLERENLTRGHRIQLTGTAPGWVPQLIVSIASQMGIRCIILTAPDEAGQSQVWEV